MFAASLATVDEGGDGLQEQWVEIGFTEQNGEPLSSCIAEATMKLLAALGVVMLALLLGAAAYAYLGFYNVAASEPHTEYVRWSLDTALRNSVQRHAAEGVGEAPSLGDAQIIRAGAGHYQECIVCHGGPGKSPAEFSETMRPQPPDLAKVAARWNDAELFWIVNHGIRMTGMPAFGRIYTEDKVWAIVAFIRQLPDMSEAEFAELTGASQETDPPTR